MSIAHEADAPAFAAEPVPPRISGWMAVPEPRITAGEAAPVSAAVHNGAPATRLPMDLAIPAAKVALRSGSNQPLSLRSAPAKPVAPQPAADARPARTNGHAAALAGPALPPLAGVHSAPKAADPLALETTPAASGSASPSADTRPAVGVAAQVRIPEFVDPARGADPLHGLRALARCEEMQPPLAAAPAWREVVPGMRTVQAVQERLPEFPCFALTVAETDVFEVVPPPAVLVTPMPAPAAACALREVRPSESMSAIETVAGAAVRLPECNVAPAETCGVELAAAMGGPASAPAAREVMPRFGAAWMAGEPQAQQLPELTTAVAEGDLFEAVPPPPLCDRMMPAPAAMPAARELSMADAATPQTAVEPRLPLSLDHRLPVPHVESEASWEPPLAAAPAALAVSPRARTETAEWAAAPAASIVAPQLAMPRLTASGVAAQAMPNAADPAKVLESAAESETILPLRLPDVTALRTAGLSAGSRSVEPQPAARLMVSAAAAPAPVLWNTAARLPATPAAATGGAIPAPGLCWLEPRFAKPAAGTTLGGVARVEPLITIRQQTPQIEAVQGALGLPETGFIPVEFYCQRAASTPARSMQWATLGVPLTMPGFSFSLVADRNEDLAITKPLPKADVTEILSHPEAKRRPVNRNLGRIVQIAAALLLAASLWFAYRSIGEDGRVASVNRVRSDQGALETASAAAVKSQAKEQKGAMAKLYSAIADRAAGEAGDTLREGMGSWGVPAKTFAAGWARRPEGYTHIGELELFRPSLNYRDYRLEFMGQVESKGMSWAVRARDKQNYYAMKFKVVEAGLRPVLALVHYPVVGGKKGHAVETPLAMMVHRDMPFRFELEVAGNRLTAMVEGQKVESWTDDLQARGGVGFFAEAGERARLYWMKVSKNQDWLGAVCSFIAGGETQTASMWGTRSPAGRGAPDFPAHDQEAALAESESSRRYLGIRASARLQNQGRIQAWIC